jgi:hypothetical protein
VREEKEKEKARKCSRKEEEESNLARRRDEEECKQTKMKPWNDQADVRRCGGDQVTGG